MSWVSVLLNTHNLGKKSHYCRGIDSFDGVFHAALGGPKIFLIPDIISVLYPNSDMKFSNPESSMLTSLQFDHSFHYCSNPATQETLVSSFDIVSVMHLVIMLP